MTCAVNLDHPDDISEFRSAARRLLAAGVDPANVVWSSGPTGSLFADPLPVDEKIIAVPRAFADLAAAVICHRDQQRLALLYQALWRIDRGEHCLMQQVADPLVHRLQRLATSVGRDQHRMTAFLRFRKIAAPPDDIYIAWYEPQHLILRRTASFFIDRFTNMRFSILTADLTLHWDRLEATYAPGMKRSDAPADDAVEDQWRRYYAATFNPARINTRLMKSHMPKQFWRDLPEAGTIPDLIAHADSRTQRMIETTRH
jgi:DNA polymerase